MYNGNQDIIVNIRGTANMARALKWAGRDEFRDSRRDGYWVRGH